MLYCERKIKMSFLTSNDLVKQVHPDLANLIWRTNQIKETKKFKLYGTEFVLTDDEPSVIPEKFEIEAVENPEDAIPIQGLPIFKELDAEQKYVYIQFLRNPYNGMFPQYYVFLLQCGLERHLLNGNRVKALDAFNVMLKLRDAYREPCSFRYSSARCIMYITALSNNESLFDKALETFNIPEDLKVAQDYYIFAKYKLNKSLTPNDLMILSSKFGFKNKGYINKYPQIFEETLKKLLIQKTNSEVLHLNKYVYLNKTNTTSTFIGSPFANKSILYTEQKLDKTKCDRFVCSLLEETHNSVKSELAKLRKNRNAPKEESRSVKKATKKHSVSNIALQKIEDKVLSLYNNTKQTNSAYEQYEVTHKLCQHYFDYRKDNYEYYDLCISYAKACIDLIPKIKLELEERKSAEIEKYKKQLSHYISVGNDTMQKIIQNNINSAKNGSGFEMPFVYLDFNNLITVYKETKRFSDAVSVCDSAIKYYSESLSNSRLSAIDKNYKIETFQKEKEKLEKML